MAKIVIRENIPEYMAQLETWLEGERGKPAEEMGAFFETRLDSYEQHMALWRQAYEYVAGLIPEGTTRLLDLGCGTGLELEGIFARLPGLRVDAIDLSEKMLAALRKKYPGDNLRLIKADYTHYEYEPAAYDMAISFESLHHLTAEEKAKVFSGIYSALRAGGVFINADYIACCPREEELTRSIYDEKMAAYTGTGRFIHFDTPLTLSSEMKCLRRAGFDKMEVLDSIDGATVIRAVKASSRPVQSDPLSSITDGDGRLTKWPAKRTQQELALARIAALFSPGRSYTQKEVNDIIDSGHTYNDPVALRRFLVEAGYLKRERDGSSYWV